MMSFEQAAKYLDRCAEELPQDIFRNLNGGVNLLPEERKSPDGRWTLGLYHNDGRLGRYIEIFYGSFLALYPGASDEKLERELKRTLHHELTHHLESRAGDRSLERWDDEQTELWLSRGEALEVSSVLFYSDCQALAAAAHCFFLRLSREKCPEVRSGWASEPESEAVPDAAADAARALGAELRGKIAPCATAGLVAAYDTVMCMTEREADCLAERFPEHDERIMCIGETDIRPPATRQGWKRTMQRLENEVRALAEELAEENGDD